MSQNINLKERRIALGYTQAYVAKLVGVSESTISRWESGNIANMKRSYIVAYANALRLSPADIVGAKDTEEAEEPAPVASVPREIDGIFDMLNDAGQAELCRYGRYLGAQEEYKAAGPVIRKAPARIIPLLGMSFAAGAPESPGDLLFQDYETTDPRAEFAIHVNGNSMEPALPDGSIALGVKRHPRDGEVGAFFLDGGFLVKQFCSDGKNTYLLSLNRARSDADETIWASGGRDLRCVGTILLDRRYPLPD